MKKSSYFCFLSWLSLLPMLLPACTCRGKITDSKDDIRGRFSAEGAVLAAKTGLYSSNRNILQTKYKAEREYFRNYTTTRLGLALSGGGTRSASFSIGVLKALTELDIMKEVDVISAVSGGAYATYWYYSQNCYLNRPRKLNDRNFCNPVDRNPVDSALLDFSRDRFMPDDLFLSWNDPSLEEAGTWNNNLRDPDDYRFQLALQNSSDILNYNKKDGIGGALSNVGQQTADIGTLILSMPFHWLFNGVFDWDVNLNPYRRYYQNGLERTYGFVPLAYNLEHFANDTSLILPANQMQSLSDKNAQFLSKYDQILFPRANAQQISLSEVGDYLKAKLAQETDRQKSADDPLHRRGLPFFIINTTGGYDRGFRKFQNSSDKAPPKDNFCAEPTKEKICAIRNSFDKSDREIRKAVFEFTPVWYGSNLVGYYSVLDNPDEISFSHAVAISGAAVDGQAEQVDIAGNSHGSSKPVESALNLINSDIGYRITNPQSNTILNTIHKLMPFPLYLLFDAFEDDKSPSLHLSDGGQSDNLGLFSLVRRGVENIIVVDAESDGKSTFTSAQHLKIRLEKELGLRMKFDQFSAINVYNTPITRAVIRGEIEGLVDAAGNPKNIALYYVKLSLDRNKLQGVGQGNTCKYPFSVTSYQEGHHAFPHEPTSDIFYSPEQYRAYRDLGYTIVMENRDKFMGLLSGN